MRTLISIILILFLCGAVLPASAQKKPASKKTTSAKTKAKAPGKTKTAANEDSKLRPEEKALKLYNEAKALRVKHFNTKDAKMQALMISKFKEAGRGFLKADTFKTNAPEKLYLQTYAMNSFASAFYFMREDGKQKDIIALADEITPKLWMATQKLPKEAVPLVKKDTSIITPADFNTCRAGLFEEITNAAADRNDYKNHLKYGVLYLSILPPPEYKSDTKLFKERLSTLAQMAQSSIKLKNGDSCRKYVMVPFEYVVANRSLIADKVFTSKTLRTIDTMLRNPKFNYTDFDNDAKIRAQAARAFDKLEDHECAYRLYDDAINSGNRGISMMMARAESAALMGDMAKLDIALLAIEEKKYTGRLNDDYERKLKEYKKTLKRSDE